MDKKVLRNLSYGVYVVTSKENDKNVGCIANSIMQVTSNPCTIAVSVNHDNYTNKVIKENNQYQCDHGDNPVHWRAKIFTSCSPCHIFNGGRV